MRRVRTPLLPSSSPSELTKSCVAGNVEHANGVQQEIVNTELMCDRKWCATENGVRVGQVCEYSVAHNFTNLGIVFLNNQFDAAWIKIL